MYVIKEKDGGYYTGKNYMVNHEVFCGFGKIDEAAIYQDEKTARKAIQNKIHKYNLMYVCSIEKLGE